MPDRAGHPGKCDGGRSDTHAALPDIDTDPTVPQEELTAIQNASSTRSRVGTFRRESTASRGQHLFGMERPRGPVAAFRAAAVQ